MKLCPHCNCPMALINCQVWHCYNCGYEEPRYPETEKTKEEADENTVDNVYTVR